MKGQGAAELEHSICTFLEKHHIKFSDCRGQSYDSASNMSGKYSGLQIRIREKNPLADNVPCFTHSLNLVGHRWELLVNALDDIPIVKRFSDTRWAAHSNASNAHTVDMKK